MPIVSTRRSRWRGRRDEAPQHGRARGRRGSPRGRRLALPPPKDAGGWRRQLRQPGRGDPVRRRRDHRDPRTWRAQLPPERGRGRIFQGAQPMTGFIVLGVVALIAGVTLLVTGIRKHEAQHPGHVAMLIGGMMLTAFGLVLAGFAIAYERTAPLDLNSGTAQ